MFTAENYKTKVVIPKKKKMENINVPKPKILTGGEMLSEADRMARAEIEAKRGIVRDEKGGIVRSKEWIKRRITQLEYKKTVVKETIEDAKNLIEKATKEMTKAMDQENGNADVALEQDKIIDKQKGKIVILKQRLGEIDAKIKELK